MTKKLFIGIACYDNNISADSMFSLQNFILNHKSSDPSIRTEINQWICRGDSHVDRVRNRIAKAFLTTDCTHLLFLDSDIFFLPRQIDSLLARDCDIVGGLYAKKEIGDPKWVIYPLPGKSEPDESGLLEVKFVGTGFMLIARRVFEKFIEQKPEIEYDDNSENGQGTMWAFFDAGIVNREFLTEDWKFCHDWREMGGKIFADTRITLGHTGKVVFPVLAPPVELEIRP